MTLDFISDLVIAVVLVFAGLVFLCYGLVYFAQTFVVLAAVYSKNSTVNKITAEVLFGRAMVTALIFSGAVGSALGLYAHIVVDILN